MDSALHILLERSARSREYYIEPLAVYDPVSARLPLLTKITGGYNGPLGHLESSIVPPSNLLVTWR